MAPQPFEPEPIILGIICYILCWVVNKVLLCLSVGKKLVEWKSVSVAFQVLVSLFLIARTAWMFLQLKKAEMDAQDFIVWHMVLARIASSLYFSAFSVVLASWVQLLSAFSQMALPGDFPRRLFWTVVISNVAIWILLVISVFLWVYGDWRKVKQLSSLALVVLTRCWFAVALCHHQTDINALQTHPFFSVITWATGAMSLVGALVFVVFGLRLYCGVRRLRKAGILHKAATRVRSALLCCTSLASAPTPRC